MHNLRYKLLALACALGLHFMYGREEAKPLTPGVVRAQVKATNVPEGLAITSLPVVAVGLQGPDPLMAELRRRADGGVSEVDATIDLRNKGVGVHTVPVSVQVKAPLASIPGDAPLATVTLEEIVERTVPIEVVPQGSVAPGYRWESTSVFPADAVVQGPRSAVEQVARLEALVPVRRATQDVETEVEIQAVDSRDGPIKNVRFSPDRARVHVRIARILRYKTVPVLPQPVGSPATGFRVSSVEVDPAVVTVSGSGKVLGEVQAVQTDPIDLNGITESVTRQVQLRPATGITVVRVPSVQVKVVVTPIMDTKTVEEQP